MSDGIENIGFVTKTDAYIFVSTPYKFYSGDTRSKVKMRLGEVLFIETNYEVMNSYSECYHYSNIGNDTYDHCKWNHVRKMISARFNCTIPFVDNHTLPFCGKDNAKAAFNMYKSHIYAKTPNCHRPCSEVHTWFGFPDKDSIGETEAKLKLYFKTIVKVTEDFISYDFLRYNPVSWFLPINILISSMVSEIGGYSGLLIGFSVLDLAVVIQSIVRYFQDKF